MTKKQDNILSAALERFANEGYNATSTSQIAKQAGVSEGLIFRHFKNKKGLLEALIQEADKKVGLILLDIINESEAKNIIRKTIDLPFSIDKKEYDFWRLQFKLKWQKKYHHPQKMQPLIDKLTWAFTKLKVKEAEKEAKLLSQIIDTISTGILRDGLESQQLFQTFLHEKYNV